MENEEQLQSKQSITTKLWLFFLDIAQTFLITGAVFFVVTYFFFRPFQVSGDSMYSNFKDKEYILTNLITLRFNTPDRGDVVVFKSPSDASKDFIKRIIGLPGDEIMLKEGEVFINSEKINEPYLDEGIKTYGGIFIQDGERKIIPENNYFVLGDNRNDSSDSRTWGFVSKEDIKGISFFVYWPLSEVHVIKNPYQ